MRFLFVHNNFPAQFKNLANALAADPDNDVWAICASGAPGLPGVRANRYAPPEGQTPETHPFARHFEMECRRAEQVLFTASAMAASGFVPDVIFAHCGWGENLPLRAVFPRSRIVIYSEFYFRATGQDINFDPEGPQRGADAIVSLHCRNASTLIALAESDLGIAPTHWQRSTFPLELRSKIQVAHEGVDTDVAKPNPNALLSLPNGRVLRKGDEVVTFVARNLEQPRGYHIFMRALPAILRAQPHAQIVIIGGDGFSYGPPPPPGTSWKDVFLKENAKNLDLRRVHFLGRASYQVYLSALQVSAAHVYLTYPFVLSWSLVEAMSVGCNIIASDTAPVQEVINDGNGSLTPFFDAGGLAARVISVLARPREYAGRATNARETAVARFDKVHCTARLKRLIGVGE